MQFIKSFKEISKKDISIAGGKGANLGEMAEAKIPVPLGFVILISGFNSIRKSQISNGARKFLERTDINAEIETMWKRINIKDIESVEKNSEIVRNLIIKSEVPQDLEKEIIKAYQNLKSKFQISNFKSNPKSKIQIADNFFVAVRSSATAEDSKIDSWAGELESYLNITEKNLMENIKKCWASLYTPRALFYRELIAT